MKSIPESPSAILKTAPVTHHSAPKESGTAESQEEKNALRQIDQAIARCRELLHSPLFNERTRREYDNMFQELREEREVDKARENISFLLQTKNKAETSKFQFASMLEKAVFNDWIDSSAKSRWWDRFNDPNALEWTRREWIQKEFPKLLKNWQDVAEKRTKVEKMAKERQLTAKEIPELADIFNKKGLLSQHYQTRRNKVDKAMALVMAYKVNKTSFIRFIENELNDAATSGWMHDSKVGAWMERVMNSENPEKFASKILFPFIQNWKEARADFDRLNRTLDRQGIPRGFRPVNENDFLLMEYKQRTSYCSLAWIRLEDAAESDKALASAKLRIRHNLDTKDWEGAEEDLAKALSEWPNNRELLSMQTYLKMHRPKEEESKEKKETPDPNDLLQNLRHMLRLVPGNLHALYTQGLEDGPAVLHRLQQIIGNASWAAERGYTSENEKLLNIQDQQNKERTAFYARHGHSKTLEHNILNGETAVSESINDDCTKAQYVYMSSLGKSALMEKVRKNKDNEQFGYWTILHDTDITLDKQITISKNLHYPMKNALRELDRMDYKFTSSGALMHKNGTPAFSNN